VSDQDEPGRGNRGLAQQREGKVGWVGLGWVVLGLAWDTQREEGKEGWRSEGTAESTAVRNERQAKVGWVGLGWVG